jgi:hypothetical protein
VANEARQATRKLLEECEGGVLCWEQVARDALNYMSEDEVADMGRINGYFEFDEDEDE